MSSSLYLDECCPPLLKDLLLSSNSSLSIQHAREVGQQGKSDAENLLYAVKTGCVLVTVNIKDFVLLHRWWKTFHSWGVLPAPHPGILAAPHILPVEKLAEALLQLLNQAPAPVLENNMYIYRQEKWTSEHW